MTIARPTIAAAFEQHRRRYVDSERGWNPVYHLDLWHKARTACEAGSEADFEYVYEELRRRWQAFRGGTSHWTARETFAALCKLDRELFTARLSDLRMANIDAAYRALKAMEGLKKNRAGPSVVALSKVLHFWNPRLFIIVDQGVMWDWVLSHQWLWEQIKPVRDALDHRLLGGPCKRSDAACDVVTYLAVLLWSGELLRANPAIVEQFGHYIGKMTLDAAEAAEAAEAANCDAIAAEWFLLGLVELPPAGVRVETKQLQRGERDMSSRAPTEQYVEEAVIAQCAKAGIPSRRGMNSMTQVKGRTWQWKPCENY